MKERLSTDPQAYQAMVGAERYIAGCGLPRDLTELVKLRVSMINGCAFCVDMHWTALRKGGASEAKLYGLSSWREQSGYTDRERAALAWAETVNDVARTHVPDDAFAEVSKVFSPKEVADLTYVVGIINVWNRLSVAFRTPPASAPR